MTNNGCKRYCEVMNRPAYIVLFKGDDSDFEGNQSVDIVIDTELDTTGMKAHFRFMDFVQDFDSIPENKTLSLVFPNAKTSEFPLGAADATLRFEDASGKFRTVSNRIHIVVTNSVYEAYDNEDGQSITVTVKGTVTWEMIQGKPPIPEPITIDTALSQTSENPVQNKVVAKALYTGFTEWEFSDGESHTLSAPYLGLSGWVYQLDGQGGHRSGEVFSTEADALAALSLTFIRENITITATRHLVTPTKTSQLTNDGPPATDPNAGHPFATTNQIPAPVDISGKLDGAAAYPVWNDSSEGFWPAGTIVSWKGKLYRTEEGTADPSAEPGTPAGATDWAEITIQSLLAAKANAADVNAALAQKASLSDLPYALVEPGEWEFSGYSEGVVIDSISYDSGLWTLSVSYNGDDYYLDAEGSDDETELTFLGIYTEPYDRITATRASLPGHLLDRAGNRVVVSGDTILTLPALVNAGKLRDFLVRLEISGSTVPTITFAAPTGETITYETDGDEFPVPDEAGTWLYSFTETAAHKFAVSLKKVNEVAAPQTQGGS